MHQHATKPATLAVGLSDSPAGLAAWTGEKIIAWSSTRPDGSPAFDRELLLGTLTLYWATNTITTSLLPYWHTATSPARPSRIPTCRRSPPRSASSAVNELPFPSHPESLLSATTTSPPGLNTPPAATSPPSPNLNCSPAAYATHFARCDTGPETHHHSLPLQSGDPGGCQWPSEIPQLRPDNPPLVAIVSPRWWPSNLPTSGVGLAGVRSGA